MSPVDRQRSWPSWLWLVRHGQSAGNVARDRAEGLGQGLIQIAQRDADVPLSALGERQSGAVARWFSNLPADERPDVLLTSPYERACQTASIIAGHALEGVSCVKDERLREKEFGVLDRLTKAGIAEHHPEQAKLRARVGKFYYRPPGGESWCDVILRVRSVADEIQLQHGGRRVLVVAHQVIVLCFRYVLEHLDEQQLLNVDAEGDVANCSVTSYRGARGDDGRAMMALVSYNQTTPLEADGAAVTAAADPPVAPR